ncbi:hydroxyisourate hydrolase [Curtobacterium sp. MCPF17_052]|uniref:hydroxyisourate hydrolase n=1 Tax=Curtobacterium sp. MCPF17_052 TaxID=2175655 RepID=UPI0024DF829B|nr:hydroxyisourate hydrolase [Curtobacterium sp. MCPF17_052]WIB13261.1 hydroxyisourate hydrolase [Curtobacterium sp. MCPF17_052]
MSHLSTHVLDTTNGWPATGISVSLTDADGALVASGRTDGDGRISSLGPDLLPPGEWTLSFATGAYWAALDTGTFHPPRHRDHHRARAAGRADTGRSRPAPARPPSCSVRSPTPPTEGADPP